MRYILQINCMRFSTYCFQNWETDTCINHTPDTWLNLTLPQNVMFSFPVKHVKIQDFYMCKGGWMDRKRNILHFYGLMSHLESCCPLVSQHKKRSYEPDPPITWMEKICAVPASRLIITKFRPLSENLKNPAKSLLINLHLFFLAVNLVTATDCNPS